jgi:hypothetical protein
MSGQESKLRSAWKVNVIDAATVLTGVGIVSTVAKNGGPLAVGFATAAVALPFLYAAMGVFMRALSSEQIRQEEFLNRTGLELTMVALKNMNANWKQKLTGAAVVGFFGATAWALATTAEESTKRHESYRADMVARPVLDAGTVLRTDTYTAADIYCKSREGNQRSAGTEVPVTHNGVNYKVICP